jgi:hypothetical protein
LIRKKEEKEKWIHIGSREGAHNHLHDEASYDNPGMEIPIADSLTKLVPRPEDLSILHENPPTRRHEAPRQRR